MNNSEEKQLLLEYIEDEEYGKLAHFFSSDEGRYYCRVIEEKDFVVFDRLSESEQSDLLTRLNMEEDYENTD